MFNRNLILCLTFLFTFFPLPEIMKAQDQGESSRRENELIKAVEKSGGRVYRISAADTTREISFALSSKPVGDDQLKNINGIGEVIWLNLAGTKISDAGLKQLEGMPLQKLHLERTKISDEGLKHLKGFKDLTYLNVYDTQVTDSGLEHLKKLKSLKKLYVWKSKVTEAGMKKLNASLPDLEIVGELKLVPVVVEEPKEEPKQDDAKKENAKKKEPAKKGNDKKDKPKKDEKTNKEGNAKASDKKPGAANKKKRNNQKQNADQDK